MVLGHPSCHHRQPFRCFLQLQPHLTRLLQGGPILHFAQHLVEPAKHVLAPLVMQEVEHWDICVYHDHLVCKLNTFWVVELRVEHQLLLDFQVLESVGNEIVQITKLLLSKSIFRSVYSYLRLHPAKVSIDMDYGAWN